VPQLQVHEDLMYYGNSMIWELDLASNGACHMCGQPSPRSWLASLIHMFEDLFGKSNKLSSLLLTESKL
jgi:hypothetical protein